MIPLTSKVKGWIQFLIVAGLVLIVGVFVMLPPWDRGPLHQGKRAGDWLDELVATEGESPEAKQAFREMGAQAVPYLSNQLTNKAALRDRYVAFKSNLPHALFMVTPEWRMLKWPRRKYSAQALGEIGPTATAAIPALIEAVNMSEPSARDRSTGAVRVGAGWSPEARKAAIHALWRIDPNSSDVISTVVGALLQKHVFGMSQTNVPDVAIMALAELGPKSKAQIPIIIQNLKYWDKKWIRPGVTSTYAFGGLAPGYASSVPSLITLLKDSNPRARETAGYYLGTLRPKDLPSANAAIPALKESLQDVDNIVRLTAAEAIWNIDRTHSPATVPTLIGLLDDPDYTVRLRAVDLLRQIGPQAVLAQLALEKLLQDKASIVRVWAAEASAAISTATTNHATFQ